MANTANWEKIAKDKRAELERALIYTYPKSESAWARDQ